VTVLGGLLSSTLLNLFVLPALAHRYVRIRQEAPGREALQPAQ
jgi:Cu/Ag efflux pump CusA